MKLRLVFKISLVILFLVLVTWGYRRLTDPLIFPITNIAVKGDYPNVKEQQLKDIILPYAQLGFFGLSAPQLEQALLQDPWINQVTIRRIWPSRVEITLSEKHPVAIWNQTGLLMSDGTYLIPVNHALPDDLPHFTGPQNQQQQVLTTWIQMQQLFAPLNLTVQTIDLSDRRSWTLKLSNDITVIVGQNEIWERLKSFVAIYPKVIGDNKRQAVSVDLRYQNGLAVKWGDPASLKLRKT
ncbi:MAG: cell division protein FtsQ/DivIB [Gammaproteobacteria bacterium]|nr:cell division protein FtsQ/DivIB [Gammaproteobacteria bacterium]